MSNLAAKLAASRANLKERKTESASSAVPAAAAPKTHVEAWQAYDEARQVYGRAWLDYVAAPGDRVEARAALGEARHALNNAWFAAAAVARPTREDGK